MGAPRGNRNAAGRHKNSFGFGRVAKNARRRKSLIPSVHNQIRNFKSMSKPSERNEFLSRGVSKKTKTIAKNVWKIK